MNNLQIRKGGEMKGGLSEIQKTYEAQRAVLSLAFRGLAAQGTQSCEGQETHLGQKVQQKEKGTKEPATQAIDDAVPKMDPAYAQLEAAFEKIVLDLGLAQMELEAALRNCAGKDARISVLEEERTRLMDQIAVQKAKINEIQRKYSEEETTDLRQAAKLEPTSRISSEIDERIRRLEQDKSKLLDQVAEKDHALVGLQQRYNQQEATGLHHTSEIQSLSQRFQDVSLSLNETKAGEAQDLKARVQSKEEALQKLQSQLARQKSTAQNREAELQQQLAKAQAAVSDGLKWRQSAEAAQAELKLASQRQVSPAEKNAGGLQRMLAFHKENSEAAAKRLKETQETNRMLQALVYDQETQLIAQEGVIKSFRGPPQSMTMEL